MHTLNSAAVAAIAKHVAHLGPRVGEYALLFEEDDSISLESLAGTCPAALVGARPGRRLLGFVRLDLGRAAVVQIKGGGEFSALHVASITDLQSKVV